MESIFLRNQIELKLAEALLLNEKYIEQIKKEFDAFRRILEPDDTESITNLMNDLEDCSTNMENLIEEFNLTIAQLTVVYLELIPRFKKFKDDFRQSMKASSDGVSITRESLTWSTFAASAGYDENNKILDIEFKTGGVYRYYEVPFEFSQKLLTRRSFKGFKNELKQFEVEKLMD